jgi:hypothetical protein
MILVIRHRQVHKCEELPFQRVVLAILGLTMA